MPILQGYSVTVGDPEPVSIPRATIAARIYDNDGNLVADYSAGLDFSAIINMFPPDLLRQWLVDKAPEMLYALAGID